MRVKLTREIASTHVEEARKSPYKNMSRDQIKARLKKATTVAALRDEVQELALLVSALLAERKL